MEFNLPGAWDLSTGDPSVLVAVVDTGILGAHPDFSGQLQGGYDFVADPELSGDGDGIDPDPEDPGDSSSPGGGSFHGSHVGGTIAAATDNRIGVSGVAWRARLMPLRALGGSGEGRSYDVNQAIRYAAGLDNDSGEKPPQRADIINLSLGGGGFSPTTAALFDEVRAAGVIVVAAAGNEGSSSPSYPAAYDGVISVGAVNSQQQLAGYSNFGSTVDAVAPGGDNGIDLNGDGYPDGVLSVGATVDDNGFRFAYPFLAGTSMATPHVAGVLALMKSVNADLTPADIDALLLQGALTNDLGSPGRDDRYGHGLINALAAVTAALTAAGTPPAENPFVTSSTRSLNFSSRAEQLQFSLQNGGSGPLRVIDIATTKPWLSVSPQEVDSQGLGRYRVTVERGDLSPGVYGGRVIVDTDVNALSMDVLMSVADDNGSGDVGVVYLLLTNLDDPDQVRQVVLRTQLGELDYHFDDLPGGRYDIFAGTDADNDSLICDAGEACGAYLTTDSPIELVLDGDVEDLDFPMEYLVSFLAQFSQSTQATETLTPRRRPVD